MYKKFILSLIVIGALITTSCQQNTSTPATSTIANTACSFDGHLPIAYVNIDSLLLNYNLAKDLNEEMLTRQENSRADINEKGRQLEKEVADFERKAKNNAFLSQDRFEQEQQRLMKKQQELQTYAQRLENEILMEQQKMIIRVNDSINSYIKEYNKDGKYEAILNNSSTLYIKPAYDITMDVVEQLNKRYTKSSK